MAARKQLSGLDLASQQIKNLADGSAGTDAVTLQQLQAFVRGLDWKASVRVASTASVTVASPGASIDGVALSAGDRVLLKNQSTGSENGIYDWNGSAVAMTRSSDAIAGELTADASVFVAEGTQAETQWVLSTNDPITVGTTSLTWAQFGGGSTYTAAATGGLSVTGNAFSVKLPASSGLVEDSTGLYIDTAIVTRKFAAAIGDGSTTAIVVTHNLNTRDVQVRIYNATTWEEADVDVVHTTVNTVTLNFATAPTTNQWRCVVQG